MKISVPLISIASCRRRAFSLIEVLLAIFILGIGMIMVASVFPVGADWTRQATEQSIAQSIALNAVSVIQRHYDQRFNPLLLCPSPTALPPLSLNTIFFAPPNGSAFYLQPLPFFAATTVAVNGAPASPIVPVYERAYQFGNTLPYPAANPSACTYFWTALVRVNPIHRDPPADPTSAIVLPSSSYKYDLYILVFRKGAPEQTFTINYPGYPEMNPNNFMRLLPAESYVPSLLSGQYSQGVYNASATPNITGAVPPIGSFGIGMYSGTVFRQGLGTNGLAIARPQLMGNFPTPEPVIFSPPADGTSVSPLIYIYQTTLTE